jgi:hypothetical protein
MLTVAQLQALKADINADPELSVIPNSSDGNYAIAQAYNAQANPAFTVWQTGIDTANVKKAVVWTEFIGRSQGERDAFRLMIQDGTINAADPNVRSGFNDIFSGPSGATTRANLLALAKRLSTRGEKLFATGTGSDADPATMTFEGNLTHFDVAQARDLA